MIAGMILLGLFSAIGTGTLIAACIPGEAKSKGYN